MPFIAKENIEKHVTLYTWQMTEHSDDLLQMCANKRLPVECHAKAESRRREILCERLLLNHIFGANVTLLHNPDRAPYVLATSHNISIAHAKDRLCIAVSNTPVGIDIETHRPRVLNVRDGFLNHHEKQWIHPTNVIAHLVAWTAKEAVFKVISNRSLITDYSNQIKLSPFEINGAPVTLSHRCAFNSINFNLFTTVNDHYIFTLATVAQ